MLKKYTTGNSWKKLGSLIKITKYGRENFCVHVLFSIKL